MAKKREPEVPLPDGERERVERVVAFTFGGLHHLRPGSFRQHRYYAEVVTFVSLDTYDADVLTRLVYAAHREAVRVEVFGCAPNYTRIALHPRTRGGRLYDRHPTLAEAIERLDGRYYDAPPHVDAPELAKESA